MFGRFVRLCAPLPNYGVFLILNPNFHCFSRPTQNSAPFFLPARWVFYVPQQQTRRRMGRTDRLLWLGWPRRPSAVRPRSTPFQWGNDDVDLLTIPIELSCDALCKLSLLKLPVVQPAPKYSRSFSCETQASCWLRYLYFWFRLNFCSFSSAAANSRSSLSSISPSWIQDHVAACLKKKRKQRTIINKLIQIALNFLTPFL